MSKGFSTGRKAVPPAIEEKLKKLRELKDKHEELDQQAKQVKAEFDDILENVIPQLMEVHGRETVTIGGVGGLSLGEKVHVYCKVAYEPEFFAYLRERGDGAIIKESIHHQTLCSWGKEKLAACEALPEYLTITAKTVGKFRRSNKHPS